jgi:predicted DNA binding CopG/RHH family protein
MSKKLPQFASEEEERDFWAEHDSAEYVDWSRAERVVLPNLKPSTTTISLRLPEHMLNDIKMIANKRDMPYQSLMKSFLADRLDDELRGRRAAEGVLAVLALPHHLQLHRGLPPRDPHHQSHRRGEEGDPQRQRPRRTHPPRGHLRRLTVG